MARTSKTVIGGEQEHNARMMQAASSGAEAVSQAQSQLLGQYRAGAEQANQTAQVANQVVGQGIDRNTQQKQFDTKMAEDKRQFDVSAKQRQDQTDLEAAKSGFERTGDSRSAKLEAEMQKGSEQPKIGSLDQESQQRLKAQTGDAAEMDPNGTWRMTKQRSDAIAAENKREDFKADTDRMRAISYRDQVAQSAQKALAAGDKQAYEEHAQLLANVPNSSQIRYDRLMKGDMQRGDWSDLAKMAKGSSQADPTLMQDIQAKQWTPRLQQFTRAMIAKDALEAIIGSKGDTSMLKVDWTNPKLRSFQQQVQSYNAFMGANPALSQIGTINSTEDKMRFLNVMAAVQVYFGMDTAPNPSGGMTPATTPDQQAQPGVPGAPPPEHSQQQPYGDVGAQAVHEARNAGQTPQQALKAGQAANPTASGGRDVSPPSSRRMGGPYGNPW